MLHLSSHTRENRPAITHDPLRGSRCSRATLAFAALPQHLVCSPGDAAASGLDLILAGDSKRGLFNRLRSELCETEMCPGARLQKNPPACEP